MRIYICAICLLGFLAAIGCKGFEWPHPIAVLAIGLLASGASLFGIAAASLRGWISRCALLALGTGLFGVQFLIFMLRGPDARLANVNWWDTGPELLYRGLFTMLLVFVAILLKKQWASRNAGRVHSFFASIARLQIGLGHLLLLMVVAALILTGLRVKTPQLNSLFPWLLVMNNYFIGTACEAVVALGVLWIGRDSHKTFLRCVAVTLFAVAVSFIEPYHFRLDYQESAACVAAGILQAWALLPSVMIFHERHRLLPPLVPDAWSARRTAAP